MKINCQCPGCGSNFEADLQLKLVEKPKRRGGWPKGKSRKTASLGPIVGSAAPAAPEPPAHVPPTLKKRESVEARPGKEGYAQAVRLRMERQPWPLPDGTMITHRGPEASDFVSA